MGLASWCWTLGEDWPFTGLLDWSSWLHEFVSTDLVCRIGLLPSAQARECQCYLTFMRMNFWAILSEPGFPLGQWRPHCEAGPAIEFRDGYSLYRRHGQVVHADKLHWGEIVFTA